MVRNQTYGRISMRDNESTVSTATEIGNCHRDSVRPVLNESCQGRAVRIRAIMPSFSYIQVVCSKLEFHKIITRMSLLVGYKKDGSALVRVYSCSYLTNLLSARRKADRCAFWEAIVASSLGTQYLGEW